MKLAILDDYQDVTLSVADWSPIRDLGISITVFNDYIAPSKLAETLKPFTIIYAMRERTVIDKPVLQQLTNLKLLLTNGGRNPSLDRHAAADLGIEVATVNGRNESGGGSATQEHIWALIMASARNIAAYDRGVKAGAPWQALGTERSQVLPLHLRGNTIGLVGLGHLGGFAAATAHVFGMKVLAWSPHLTESRLSEEQKRYVKVVSKEELFRESDIVSVHLILADSTRGIIGEKDLALMKSTAILVNTSRGPLIDEAAVLDALQHHRIRGGAFDVFDTEPLPADSRWRKLGDHVTLTPHVGYIERPTYEYWSQKIVEAIIAWKEGRIEDLARLGN